MKSVLDARELSFGNNARRLIERVDVQLAAGERLGLLGVNGAGKSTLLQMLAGVLAPHGGRVQVHGETLHDDRPSPRRHIGYLPQRPPVYRELTVRENLDWAGRLRMLTGSRLKTAIDSVVQQTELGAVADRLAGHLSTGMRQRLGLAQALIHAPTILILDEPTAGLDPVQTEQLRNLLRTLPDTAGVLIATHLLDDVQQLCDRVMVLESGRCIAQQSVNGDTDLMDALRSVPREAAS